MISKIVILGGGSAGWLTAGILAARVRDFGISVTLVESADVPTIGVGEGTWPTMRTTLQAIGIPEHEFLRYCSASFKQGSKFVGWRNGAADDYYYHPFTAPAGFMDSDVYGAWQYQFPQKTFCDAVTVQGAMCDQGRAPKQKNTPEYAGVLSYGYHLDAGKFGELLKAFCIKQLGVEHIVATVQAVESCENGDIKGLQTPEHGLISGDLFIDCSGSRSLLLGDHFQTPFVSCARFSVNNRALAVQVPYDNENAPVAAATVATAQSAGWAWDIGLSSRRGVGYVYSSAHIEDAAAEAELRAYIACTASPAVAEMANPRCIQFAPGYRQQFWVKNCVAVGMSAGFIEPLEASALALVELSANMIRDELPMSRAGMNVVAERFNRVFTYRWQKIIEFLKLHYVLSERRDTPYWRDVTAAESLPDSVAELLELWQFRSPGQYDFLYAEELFPAVSYQYVLYGMGVRHPYLPNEQSARLQQGVKYLSDIAENTARYANHLPTTRELLQHIARG